MYIFNKNFVEVAEKLRLLLIIISLLLIIFYFSSAQYILGLVWIMLLLINTILFVHDSQKRGSVNKLNYNLKRDNKK